MLNSFQSSDFLQSLLFVKQLNHSTLFSHKPYHYLYYGYPKSFQLISRLKGAALCDIKTKFKIKKRNPE